MNPVTIVVPVYGDKSSVAKCLAALIEHVDPVHRVLVVNDCGPDADAIGEAILATIAGRRNCGYERNSENLGFVRTCNRAVLEIDTTDNDVLLLNSDAIVTAGFLEEMLAVLYHSDRHGCVAPRSDNGSIATLPLMTRSGTFAASPTGRTLAVFAAVAPSLPRFSVVPVAPGFCLLIRRQLIRNFGLFDERYGARYSEENDFCMRINQYGFSSLLANRALVFHEGTRSFTAERKARLQHDNEHLMLSRYPHYEYAVSEYLRNDVDAVDWFADVLAPAVRTKVLLMLDRLPALHNGTSRIAVSLLSFLASNSDAAADMDIVVAAPRRAASFHDLQSFGFRIIDSADINELFDVGYCPFQIFYSSSLWAMNRFCLRIAYSHLDIVALRTYELRAREPEVRDVMRDALTLADRVIAISAFSVADAADYFGDLATPELARLEVVHQGLPRDHRSSGDDVAELPGPVRALVASGGYVLVLGNNFRHKLVRESLPWLAKIELPVVVLGPRLAGWDDVPPGVVSMPGGGLSDEAVAALYANAALVFFPSAYEGFGLPAAEAARFGKPLVMFDTTVSREVGALFEKSIEIGYFREFTEVPDIVRKLLAAPVRVSTEAGVRTIDENSSDIIAVVRELAAEPIDLDRLRQRWRYVNRVAKPPVNARHGRAAIVDRFLISMKSRYPAQYFAARSVYRRYRG